jgi:hypothetical protein
MNEDNFIDDEEVLMTNVYWVQCKWLWDRRDFYNKVRRLGAKYVINKNPKPRDPYPGHYQCPWTYMTEQQYFMFKLMDIEHNVFYFDCLTYDLNDMVQSIFYIDNYKGYGL